MDDHKRLVEFSLLKRIRYLMFIDQFLDFYGLYFFFFLACLIRSTAWVSLTIFYSTVHIYSLLYLH